MFRNYSYNPKDATDKHTFEIHDVDISIVNGIRRVMLTDIPIPGIIGEETPTVQIIKSNGPLHNEILTHRIGLIPICLTEDEIENYEDNSIDLELNLTNDTINMMNVTTSDIKGSYNGKEISKANLEKMFPKNKVSKSGILITRLRSNETLHFKAQVVKKTARFNAAFCPVSLANFFNMQDPALAAQKESILDKERAYYTNKFGDANAVQFEIEPINTLIGPKYLVVKSIEIIIGKLEDLITKIVSEGLGSNGVSLKQFDELDNTYEFNIQNEDDTLGNIIQSHIHNKYVRSENKIKDDIQCSYVGYICPHPLKTELIIRVTLENQTDPKIFRQFLQSNCVNIINELVLIKTEWSKFMK